MVPSVGRLVLPPPLSEFSMAWFLLAPHLGPIVGHTTCTSARVWMRAEAPTEARTVGVGALFKNGTLVAGSANYFRLHREYFRTGTIDFTGLSPDTPYEARLGALEVDGGDPRFLLSDEELFTQLPAAKTWVKDLLRLPQGQAVATVATFPAASSSFSFLFGSCRYPGISLLNKRSDEVFRSMLGQIQSGGPGRPRFVLMVGDQIYADPYSRFFSAGKAENSTEFHERYVEAFGSPYLRDLLRSGPTYMMLDDHEIEDNWVAGRMRDASKRALFFQAIQAYRSFQWLHGPRHPDGRIHYRFDHGGVPFFVLDTRTQRIRDDEDRDLCDNHLLGYPRRSPDGPPGQVDEVCQWLAEQQQVVGNRPKFVVSPSVFAPNEYATRGQNAWKSDSWPAFPETRRQILQTIVNRGVQNVIFLSGDVHCSITAEMEFRTRAGSLLPLKAFNITSSAFYWPFPFADGDPWSFVHDSAADGDDFDIDGTHRMSYRAFGFQQQDNFTKVTCDIGSGQVGIENFGRRGELLGTSALRLG